MYTNIVLAYLSKIKKFGLEKMMPNVNVRILVRFERHSSYLFCITWAIVLKNGNMQSGLLKFEALSRALKK
jgi:hypothetical protein